MLILANARIRTFDPLHPMQYLLKIRCYEVLYRLNNLNYCGIFLSVLMSASPGRESLSRFPSRITNFPFTMT